MSTLMQQSNAYDPWKPGAIIPVSGDKAARDLALTALFELRGKIRVKQTRDGGEMVKSGFESKPARNLSAVPIIHNRIAGEVRWLNLSDNNAGAQSHMIEMLTGAWRFATVEEEAAAKEQIAKAKDAERAARDAALELPVNRAMDKLADIVGAAVNSKKGKQ